MSQCVYGYRISPDTAVEIVWFSRNKAGDCVAEHDFCKLLEDGGEERTVKGE